MFRAAKDMMASNAARLYLDKMVAPYGKLQELRIDSGNHTARLVCLLHGETSAITIEIDPYEIETAGGKTFVKARACLCSRPWLEKLLNDFVCGRRFELPPWAAAAL